jgi:hypothetical protein
LNALPLGRTSNTISVVPIVIEDKNDSAPEKLPDQMHNLELLGELCDDHDRVHDPPRRPQIFAEILDWFSSGSVQDTAFDSDVFDVYLEPSVSRQHFPADSPISSWSVGFRRHCKSFFFDMINAMILRTNTVPVRRGSCKYARRLLI